MRMSERLRRNRRADKEMATLELNVPEHVIEDLTEVANRFGFSNYQAVVRFYLSKGLRQHLAAIEQEQAEEAAVAEFSARLKARGVPEADVDEVAAEMRAGTVTPPTQAA